MSQGLPFGFFTQALPVLLRQQEVSLPAIGFTQLLALPWALKFIWAPFVDRVGTRFRWILTLQALAVGLMLLLSQTPAGLIPVLLVAVFLANLFAATQDIATDGLAVDLLAPSERGLGNGLQVAGYRVGMILGGGLLLVIFDHTGWSLTFAAMAAMIATLTIPLLLVREPERVPVPKDSPVFKLDSWAMVLVAYKLGDSLAGGMIRPWLVDRGWALDELGWLTGFGGFGAGMLGALLGGWGAGRLGPRVALLVFGALQATSILGYLAAELLGGGEVAAVLWEHLAGGMATAALFTAMMDQCRPGHGATDYTVQASAVVISQGLGAAISGVVAGALGYGGLYGLALLVSLGGLFIVRRQFS